MDWQRFEQSVSHLSLLVVAVAVVAAVVVAVEVRLNFGQLWVEQLELSPTVGFVFAEHMALCLIFI